MKLAYQPVKLGVHGEFWHGGTARGRKSPRQETRAEEFVVSELVKTWSKFGLVIQALADKVLRGN